MKTKLDKQREKYPDMPDVPYLPMGEVVLVYRLPSEEKTQGGLYIPEEHAGPKPCGVLVAAGLAARDVLADALIEIGDVVYFGRFEGDEKEFAREEAKKGRYLLQLKVRGLLGSVDALERMKTVDIVRDKETGEHIYKQRKAA